jgi:hypothetical protein
MLSTAHSQAVRCEREAAQHAMSRVSTKVFLRQLEGHGTKPHRGLASGPLALFAILRKGSREFPCHVSKGWN